MFSNTTAEEVLCKVEFPGYEGHFLQRITGYSRPRIKCFGYLAIVVLRENNLVRTSIFLQYQAP